VKIVEKNPQTDCGTLLEPALRVEPHPSDSSLLPNGKKKAHTMNSRLLGTFCNKDFFLKHVFDPR
jgi:hypothetical protein